MEVACFRKASALALLAIPAIVLVGCSFHRLHTNEVGLDYDTFLERVSTTVYEQPGLHMLGLTHVFLRVPRTVLTVQYNEEEQDILHTRTADGLPVTLGLSFQYRYDTQRAHQLYMTFGDSYLQVLDNSARSIIANVASNYSAYRFFSDKQGIAAHMQHVLDERMSSELFASIDALQIETIELPSKFQDAILESIKVKQNIQAQLKFKENMMVTWEQDVMVAEQQKNQTITLAHGEAAKIHEGATANAIITNATIDAEISAYSACARSKDPTRCAAARRRGRHGAPRADATSARAPSSSAGRCASRQHRRCTRIQRCERRPSVLHLVGVAARAECPRQVSVHVWRRPGRVHGGRPRIRARGPVGPRALVKQRALYIAGFVGMICSPRGRGTVRG
jgi:regulator of protease activity HflC (stomatin/prohibitin superfamily)